MRRAAAAAAFAILSLASARAADFPAASAYPSRAPLDMGGWYLRGDIGYVLPVRPAGHGLLPGGFTRTFENERFGKSMMLGAGVGYKFNGWLRADVTAEWRRSYNFHATNSGSNYVDGYSDENARFSSRALMANVYLDLGTWSGLTPYIGAGVGVSTKNLRDWTSQVVCFTALCTPSGPAPSLPSATKTGFTWALMAGTAIQLTEALSLDLNYRFLNLGGVATATDAFGVSAKVGDVKINEVRLGMRYMLR